RLDIYAPAGAQGLPVLLFVHGGGFVMGDKAADGWANGAVGRWAAQMGMVGVVMNYRLAPAHTWPAGAQDVGAAIDWLRAHVGAHGGDPARIVAMGTSAGAVHVAGHLHARPDHGQALRGAVLLSGLYGYTPLDPKDERYYGGPADYAARMPREGVAATTLPLLLACAQYDPPRFQSEFVSLLAERLERHGALPAGHIANGHNHYSMAMHIGTSDTRLSGEIAAFVARCCG
ncbi:MAG TPA: alpha/beta hydrolase, partial [Novosphingobium sp.]|nr:alpha/beta hydrolase [Novosphingobium sp.]